MSDNPDAVEDDNNNVTLMDDNLMDDNSTQPDVPPSTQ